MKFTDMLKGDADVAHKLVERLHTKVQEEKTVREAAKKPEEILRGAGFKIKLVTPTSFGTQIDFAKIYPKEEIEEILKDFTIKIKAKSVFIVD